MLVPLDEKLFSQENGSIKLNKTKTKQQNKHNEEKYSEQTHVSSLFSEILISIFRNINLYNQKYSNQTHISSL